VDIAKRMGKEVTVVAEDDILETATANELCPNVDMVVSMGGDHTFLRSQALLPDRTVPIVGINTRRGTFEGVLNTQYIDHEFKETMTTNLLELLEDESAVSYEKRSRILFESQVGGENAPLKRVMCLNETLCAEKDVSSASRYVVEKNGSNVGPFKSSGLIISTGTGSTGWLYSVRQITPYQLEAIQNILGSMGDASLELNEPLAEELSKETIFRRDRDEMYYCVREGFSFTTGASEGFAKQMTIKSEMIDGQAVVDGWFRTDLSLGDSFSLTADPKYALRVANVEVFGNPAPSGY